MKGIVFSELVEMVEEVFSPEIADKIIESSHLPSGGAYTSVGTYDHEEILTLVSQLSEETGMPIDELVKTFGGHLFSRFVTLYPSFFEGVSSSFEFLETIEEHVHVEVRKL
ncbi:MAG: heme NO-binding domain-containing protein, partial [Gammaproteobacteria bacterium]